MNARYLLTFILAIVISCTEKSSTDSIIDGSQEELEEVIHIKSADFQLDVQSIIFDGEFLWITNEGTVPPYDYYIFKLDPRTGKIEQKWRASSPAENGSTYDGQFLWTTGIYSPSGMLPPWDDPDYYELIYKYSISDNNLVLKEKYALPSPKIGAGEALTVDSSGNIWVITGMPEVNEITTLVRLEFFPGEEAEHHPGLSDVWRTEIKETVVLPMSSKLHIKGAEWIYVPNVCNYLVVGGYPLDGIINAEHFIYVLDANDNFAVKWEYIPEEWGGIGDFGIYWDPKEEMIWTIGGDIFPFSYENFISFISSEDS
ncbi:hypothetical protein H8E88_30040 [candidate division KSB1 bacterium]|nr:hypothetical protein [candidate division KSB1 bacterium]